MYAAQSGSVDCLEILLDAKADVNQFEEDGMTAIHFAAASASPAACKLLLANGASLCTKDDDGRKAIDHVPVDCFIDRAERVRWEELLGPRSSDFPVFAKNGPGKKTSAKKSQLV